MDEATQTARDIDPLLGISGSTDTHAYRFAGTCDEPDCNAHRAARLRVAEASGSLSGRHPSIGRLHTGGSSCCVTPCRPRRATLNTRFSKLLWRSTSSSPISRTTTWAPGGRRRASGLRQPW